MRPKPRRWQQPLGVAVSLLVVLLLPPRMVAEERPGLPGARMSWLDNGTVRLGCDLDFGGSITWFSLSEGENLINNFDAGRQVQMAFYGGPVPYAEGENQPADHWKHLGWNPIQSGDDFGNGSEVLHHENDGRRIELRCRPLHWPLDRAPAECVFSMTIELHGATAKVTCRFRNARRDRSQYPARHQELPAVYANGSYHRVTTYTGSDPFTGGPVEEIPHETPGKHPWHRWVATESWAALLNDGNWGIGVWAPGRIRFTGGFAGKPGKGGSGDTPTGYLAPLGRDILDADIEYHYSYDLILGSLEEIRAHVYRRSKGRPELPEWTFASSREGWAYHQGTDSGWPITGSLRIDSSEKTMQMLSPLTFWKAERAPVLELEILSEGKRSPLVIRWIRHRESHPRPEDFVQLPLKRGESVYRVVLAQHEGYSGGMNGLRLDVASGERFELLAVRLINPPGN